MLKTAEEASWRNLNDLSTFLGCAFLNITRVKIIIKYPRIIPIKGDNTIKIKILVIPEVKMAEGPPINKAGPIKPPMRACETLMGIPRRVHTYTQAMAPKRPPRITYSLIIEGSTIPLPMVVATVIPKKNTAAKLKKAAHKTAIKGDNTFVETTVAIELAASFIPFKKSNNTAIMMVITTIVSMA